jgi:uncharacterized OsmC-like protein
MKSTSTVVVTSTGTGLQVKAGCREFEFVFDEPVEMGGTDTSMNPIEGLLCALGACQSIATLFFANMNGVPLDSVEASVEGDLDPDGFTGADPAVRNGLQEIRVRMQVKGNDKEAARKIAELAQERCPAGDCLKNPVPIIYSDIVVE